MADNLISQLKMNRISIIAGIFFFLLVPSFFFGLTGAKAFIAIFLFFLLPFFLLFSHLPIERDETLFFSLFIGLVVYSQLLWTIDRLFHDIYLSIAVLSVALYGIGIFLVYRKRTTGS